MCAAFTAFQSHSGSPSYATGKIFAPQKMFLDSFTAPRYTTGMQAARTAFPPSNRGEPTLSPTPATRLEEISSRIISS